MIFEVDNKKVFASNAGLGRRGLERLDLLLLIITVARPNEILGARRD